MDTTVCNLLENNPDIQPIDARDLDERDSFVPHDGFLSPSVVNVRFGVEIMDANAPGPDAVSLQKE